MDVQRAGPSTGMPTKTEQGDLLQAMFGRNGESPVAIVAPATASDCFNMAIEAWRIAIKYRTPVIFLSDGYLGMGSEPWLVPDVKSLPTMDPNFASDPETFQSYARDPKTLARPWAIPGTPGLEHRIGGLEKADITGNVSYDPANHDKMVRLRAEKIAGIAQDVPDVEVSGDESGGLLVLGWGSTYGVITTAVQRARAQGKRVSAAHLRHLNPLPANLGKVIGRYDRVLMPEMNLGQMRMLLRAKFLVDIEGLNKVSGRPFTIAEVENKIAEIAG
jgi:2-oxoglutarate ferredoxin oxidoreductase subunit alpha